MIAAARDHNSAAWREALETLFRIYWFPLYGFARRVGHSATDAEDLTQAFFAAVLEKHYLQAADPRRGRFRTFLFTAFRRFLNKQRQRAKARKRGGGKAHLPLDFTGAESRYQREPAHRQTAQREFDRRWALTILERVLQQLAGEYARRGKARLFEIVRPWLVGTADRPGYAEAAAQAGLTEGALKVAVHRVRQRYRAILREEVSRTLDSPDELDDELAWLLLAVGRR